MRGPSASECAGFALSTSIARKRFGWSVRISSGITLQGEPADDARAGDRSAADALPRSSPRGERHERGRDDRRARLAEVAGQQEEQPVQVATSVEWRFICTPRSSKLGDARGRGRCGAAPRAPAPRGRRSLGAVGGDRQRREVRQHLLEPVGVGGEPVARHRVLLHQHADHRGEQEGVGAGLHLEVDVGELGGLRAARIDDDQRARRVCAISFSVTRARGMLCESQGFLPRKSATSQCSKSARV